MADFFYGSFFKLMRMKKMLEINAGGVPEHFNTPWYLASEQNRLEHANIQLNWHECHGGTGEMNKALRDGTLDMAVLLTEGIVTDIVHGNPSKIVQFYVNSPLRWGIHVSAKSEIYTLEDLKGKKFAISRPKSGSHLMAYVNADKLNHPIHEDDFVVVKNLKGGREALKNGEADVFLWEKFTTQPYVDTGEFRCIGECPTPWPCFVIAVRDQFLKSYPEAVKTTINAINNIANELKLSDKSIPFIADRFGLQENEVKKWFKQLEWNYEQKEHEEALIDVLQKLTMLGIVDLEKHPVKISSLRSNLMQKDRVTYPVS